MKPSPNKARFTDLFIKSIQTFGGQLGPVFITLNGPFNPAYAEDFYAWPGVLHMQLTLPKVFIRFVGNSLHPTDYPRVDHWVKRMKKWMDLGIEEIYFFMHMHDEGLSPELTQYVVKQLNRKTSIKLPEVVFVT